MELGATPASDPAGADNRRLRPRPLVIRANPNECVKVTLTNELDEVQGDGLPNNPRVGMKVYGPSYDAQTSDGSAVGYNNDTTVGRNETISMYWKAPSEEGTFLFRDQATMSGSEANSGSTGHGLHGAFVVEPAGSTWRDPETGQPLYDGGASGTDHTRLTKQSGDSYIDADIVTTSGAFRETVQISQDELPGGNGFAFNYGAEPAWNRIAVNPAGENPAAEQLAPDAIGEETSLSSWTYGDPALIKLASGKGPWLPNAQRTNLEDCGLENSCYVSNVTHTYPGDPTKIRFSHAGVKETHVFHLHANQWRIESKDSKSTIIDSQTFGPGESFTADLIGGAGSKAKTVGDSIFHCHLYPHFADGFWALLRVHDVLEDGTNKLPDGTRVRETKPLPGAAAPPAADLDFDGQGTDNPGYPRFMPGKYGWRAPQPPNGMSEQRQDDPATTDVDESKDDPTTIEREDLQPATRVVAGRPLDKTALASRTDAISQELSTKLDIEQNRMLPDAKPGAPFTDPCKLNPGAREVTYNVSVIQTDVVYNERGDHDTQGRIMVPTKDVPAILDGTKKPEPLFIRVNTGDCINFNLTNHLPNWYGADAFVKLAQTNMVGGHIHLVKFDVLASDGSSNGWNYQQAAFTDEQAKFNKDIVAGTKPCNWAGCRLENPATWDPKFDSGQIPPGQTITERWYADTELRTVFTHDHHFAALDQNRGYFGALIVEPKGMDFRNPKTGEFYQPGNGSTPGAPTCGTPENNACVGNAAGTAMDVIGPGPSDDFREFGLAIQDFVSLTKKDGDPTSRADTINAPAAPEEFPDDDPGVMGINYRNAPFQLREKDKAGNPSDPAHVFSSAVHGDPMTPVLQTYAEDPVRIRTIQGSQEEQHVLTMNGMRWREEPDDPNSPLINSKAIGISEAFNFEVPRISCAADERSCAGDYLYGGTATDDAYLGAWGILRARSARVPSLLPLPDNPKAADTSLTTPESTATGPATSTTPPESTAPGTACPTGAPVKKYEVVAMQAKLKYNKDGDNDPHGLIYALAADAAAIKDGTKKPEPLVLRANEGDCIEVGLSNRLTPAWLSDHGNAGTAGDPTLPTEPVEGTKSGLRVSLHPQLVKYDVRGSDGSAVGYNRDQTVAPGDRKLYRWYADDVSPGEIGTTNLTDFGDVRGHRHHGLFAGLNIEPKGATYNDPVTGEQIKSGVSADIRVPGPDNDFREFTTFFQDGLNLHDSTGAPIKDEPDHPPTPEEPVPAGLDAEDQGEKGFNYGSSPFDHRLPAEQMSPDGIHPLPRDGRSMADVFSSKIHGDPDTPIFRSYAGDPMKMRVLQGSDKPRQHSFQISGQSWKAQPNDPNSHLIGTQGGISVGRTFNLNLSPFGSAGDYRYGCGVGFHHLSGGLWGIMRVYQPPSAAAGLNPTAIGDVDNPHVGGHPIVPLEVANAATSLTLDAAPATIEPGQATVLSGKLSTPNGPLENRAIVVEAKPAGAAGFTRVAGGEIRTGTGGVFSLADLKPLKTTEYRASFAGSPGTGLAASQSTAKQVIVMGGASLSLKATLTTVNFGQTTNLAGALAKDGAPLANKTVTLEQKPAGATDFAPMPGAGRTAQTSAEGRFSFANVKPVKNTEYRVTFAGDPAAGIRAAESVIGIKVKVVIPLNVAATDLKLGQSRTIAGAVNPSNPAKTGTVELTIKRNGATVLSKPLALSNSRFSFSYRPTAVGNYSVSVGYAGDANHVGSVSLIKGFKVVR
ncbi:MAG TPA: Ig-like domain repeat protein [Rubrobacteraceae bacterium]|nr:Ig-like domain repeat protein [Rubrobacteraceae bacterium]